jgi:DNA ligase (NAD+)
VVEQKTLNLLVVGSNPTGTTNSKFNFFKFFLMDEFSLIPTHCPSCNTLLTLTSTGVDLFCSNSIECPAQILGQLSYYCQRGRANIPGLSTKILEKLILNGQVKDIPDIYSLDYELISTWDGFGAKSADNLRDSIEQSRNSITTTKFLAGLGIKGIGIEVAGLICGGV